MNVPQEELNRWAQMCESVHGRLHAVLDALRCGEADEAATVAEEARGRVWRLMQAMLREGADRPETLPMPTQQDVPLELLSSPANRRLLAALLDAREAAEAVDRERGEWPDGFAEVLEDFAAEVQQEVYGPKGKDEG